MNKKIIKVGAIGFAAAATLPLVISMKTNDEKSKEVKDNGIYAKNISQSKLSYMPKDLKLIGTNGYARVYPFSSSIKYSVKATRGVKPVENLKHLLNGDVIKLSVLDGEHKGETNEYKVSGLAKTTVTPVWPKTYKELQQLIKDDSNEYFTFKLLDPTKRNDKVKVYKATVKDSNIFQVAPAFEKMAYLDGGINVVSWITASTAANHATITSSDQSTGFKSSFGTYNYGDLNAHINTGKIEPVSGFRASADLDKALLYLKFNDTGNHRFDSAEAQVSDVILRIYDADSKLLSTNKLPDQSTTLYHKSSNWFTGMLSTFDPVSSLVKGVTGLGALIAGGVSGHGTEWAKAFSGYDQNSELAKIAQWVNMGLSIAGDILTIPLTGGASSEAVIEGAVSTGANIAKTAGKMSTIFSKISKYVAKGGIAFQKLSNISDKFDLVGVPVNIIQNFLDNPSGLTMMQAMKTMLGLTNASIGVMFSSLAKGSGKVGQIANQTFGAFRKTPMTLLKTIEAKNDIDVEKIYDNVNENKAKAILINLDGYKIPMGGSYELDLNYRWKLGAAFSGSLFHWWSNSYGSLDMDLSKSNFITTLKNVSGLSIVLK